MDRRQFSSLIGTASLGVMMLQVVGCGANPHAAQMGLLLADGSILVYDIVMQGWSVLGNGRLGDCGILSATTIADQKAVSLRYEQDNHGHRIEITAEHCGKLLKGETVEIMTTVAQGHHHRVVIDPRHRRPGSQPLEINAGGSQPQTQPPQDGPAEQDTEAVYAHLPEEGGDHPDLYLAASSDLDESSVEICLDEPARCDSDATLWQRLKRYASRQDAQIFVTERQLSLDAGIAEIPLSVRAKRKRDAKALRWLLKLVKQGN